MMAMAGAGNRLHVTTAAGIDEGWLHVVDVRDEMEVVATLPLPGRAQSVVAAEGNLVATAVAYEERGDELLLIDVSAPAAPAIVARVPLAGLVEGQPYVHALAFDDGLLFAAVSGQRVLVIDVTEPERPRGVGVVPLPSAFPRPGVVLAVGHGMMVAGSGAMGVMLFAFGAESLDSYAYSETGVYVSEAYGFQFAIPSGYAVVDYGHPDALLGVSLHKREILADERATPKPEIFVTVHQNEQDLSVEEWLAAHTAETVTDTYPVYVGPRNVQAGRVAGHAALSFEDMTWSHGYVTLVVRDGTILAVGYVPIAYPGLADAFEHVRQSLTLGED
jgi:hypothetical protein